MKKFGNFIGLLLLAILLASCKANIVKNVSNELVVLNSIDSTNSFNFLTAVLKDKEIFILGEVSHGDGRSFEIKSNIVKHLAESNTFNTFAFEARDFFEIEFINGRKALIGVLDESLRENWVRRWNPWGPAKQIQTLVELLSNKSLNYIGLEPFTLNSYSSDQAFSFLLSNLENLDLPVSISNEIESIVVIRDNIISSKNNVPQEQFDFYIKTLENLQRELYATKNSEILFLAQIVQNTIASSKIAMLTSPNMTEFELNKTIDIRDEQMAKNLIWFKERNPQSKIIVWMANFHGAKKIRDVDFANGDVQRYSKFTVFAEHIVNYYGDNVYSLALTSSRGTSKIPYNFEGIETTVINAPENSLESILDQRNINYGFVNFIDLLNKKPKLKNFKFNSIMLGYVNQSGKWLNVFDGIFYIRENSIAIPIKK